MDIFTEKRFHPRQDNLLKKHYNDFYDTIFVALSPFFKLNNNELTNPAFQKSHTITFDEAKEAIDVLKNILSINWDY